MTSSSKKSSSRYEYACEYGCWLNLHGDDRYQFQRVIATWQTRIETTPYSRKKNKTKTSYLFGKNAILLAAERRERGCTKMLLSIMDLLFHSDRYLLCYRAQLSDIYFPMGFCRRENLVCLTLTKALFTIKWTDKKIKFNRYSYKEREKQIQKHTK